MSFEEYVSILKRKTVFIDRKKILFLCVGTSEVLWDSIGPNVGSFLKKNIDKNKVLGDMKNNICNKVDLFLNKSRIQNKYIISIDTAIVKKELDGEIFICNTPIIMGKAFNKNKGTVGDISIKVGVSDIEKITKREIKNRAQFIGKGICEINNLIYKI